MSHEKPIPVPELITFDFGDTLVTSDPPYFARIAMSLNELGFDHTHGQVEAAYHRADFRHAPRILELAPFDNDTYMRTFSEVLLQELNIPDDREKIIQELGKVLLAFRPQRVLMPGARELLKELQRRGIRLGIISNNDGRTLKKCEDVGIAGYFKFILDSTLEAMMKPDPRFFRLAIDKAGVNPERALHVGDLWGSDVLGAHNAGLWAVWLKNPYLDPPALPKAVKAERLFDILNLIKS